MDFELDDDQHALQEAVRDLVDQECPPSLVRAVVEDRDDGSGFWKTLVAAEWPGLTVAEEDGGTGASALELVIALEELGRGADPSPHLATTSQYVALLRECEAPALRHELLGAVCRGGTGTVAFAAQEVQARRDGERWVLEGSARHVVDGDRADQIAVVATTDDGTGVFVVPSDEVEATRQPTFDGSFHLADVTVDRVEVRAERAVVAGDVDRAVARAADTAVAGLAVTMVGASQRVLELVLEHVKHRQQFDVPIGSFQAVKHMAVDMFIAIQRARALCQFAGLAIAEDDDRRSLAASMAKAAAGDCQRLAFKNGVQLFGGLGFTWENDLQLYARRAKVGEPLLGATAEHRARVARATLARVQPRAEVTA